MAPDRITFELVSPEALLISEPVAMVVVPGAEGDMGVLPRHAPVIATLRPGAVTLYREHQSEVSERVFVAGGVVEITGERCTVLAEEAIAVEKLDRAAIEKTLKNLHEDFVDAKSEEEKNAIKRKIDITVAKLKLAS